MKKIIALSIGFVSLLSAQFAYASSSFFLTSVSTGTATTTVSYLTPGTGTTTLAVDSFQNGIPRLINGAALLIQFAGSSTASVLKTNIEYSMDGIDWYQDGGNYTNGFATTTKPFDIGQTNSFTYGYNSTPAGGAAGTNATSTRMVMINTPTRYVRAVFSLLIGGGNGAIWAQFVPQRQAQ